MIKSKYVIIGASAAGTGAVEAIREIDQSGSITVVSEETFLQYSRPMISELVSGKTTLDKMRCRPENFWQKHNVKTLTGTTAIRLNPQGKIVHLDSDEKLRYEKLLLATGGKPYVPKMDGVDKEGVFTFTTLANAERLAAKINNPHNKKAVVVGGGLIGISVSEALVKRGLDVTLAEYKNNILGLILDGSSSKMVEAAIRKAGLNISTGTTVEKIVGKPYDDKTVGGVFLTDGEQIQCEIVIIAIGVIPRTELCVGTSIKINKGIVVDNCMQTNLPDVFASGDVAETYDFVLKENRQLPLWPLAYAEGRIAGFNMAGKKIEYSGGTSMSSLKYYGTPLISIGLANPQDLTAYEVLVEHDFEKNVYRKLVLKDSVIVGMIFVNAIERTGILYYLIKNRVNVEKFKQELLSQDFGLAMLPGSLREKMRLEAQN
jgi:NAD(P)H-nitrite reductase large subunit